MGWTQAQLDALEAAIAEGVEEVKYQDKTVKYRSIKQMMALRDVMRADLGLISKTNTRIQMEYKTDIHSEDDTE